MKTHVLKCDPEVFIYLWNRTKTCEIRFNDRNYQVGDCVCIMEQAFNHKQVKEFGKPQMDTGRCYKRVISHIQSGYGLPENLVVLSFDVTEELYR